MAAKTEKPTPKRLRDAARKGQSFKSKELTMVTLVFVGLVFVLSTDPLVWLMEEYRQVLADGTFANPQAYAVSLFQHGLYMLAPVLLVCIVAAVLPALMQTGFVWASEALKLNFGAMSPLQGAKKIFSLRTVKDAVKSLLYLASFVGIATALWFNARGLLFAQVHMSPAGVAAAWRVLVGKLAWITLACIAPIAVLDAMIEFWLFIREHRMEVQEVKREHKESEGNPEIKAKRRERHMELLSEPLRADIRDSRLIIANPTHIAVGIYFRPDIIALPFISVMETNQRALAVRTYAESVGVPVIRDIRLARQLYRTHRRYTFVTIDTLDAIMRLLQWLEDVERAGAQDEVTIDEPALAVADDLHTADAGSNTPPEVRRE